MLYGVYHLIDKYSFFTNGPLWFLLALFWARIFFMFNRIHKYSTWGITNGAVISYGLYLLLCHYGVNVWSIAQGLMLYPYLCIGYLLNRNCDIVNSIEQASKTKLILISAGAIGLLAVSTHFAGGCDYGGLIMGHIPVLSFVSALIGSLIILLVSKLIEGLNFKHLVNIGRGTVVFLAVHHPLMDVIKFGLLKFGLDISGGNSVVCLVVSILTIFACYPCLVFFERHYPKLIGR